MGKSNVVSYRVQPSRPEAHLFEVQCRIEQPAPEGQQLSLPAWIPGSYMIRDFAKNIVRISAESNGSPVAITMLDKQTWICQPCAAPLVVSYEVYAWDLSVRSAHLDTSHAYFNGTSVFLCVRGQESSECQVEIVPPQGEVYRDWCLATTLKRVTAPIYGFGLYTAGNYDELIDHPVEMGVFDHATFEVAGIPHDIVITGRHAADMERLCTDLAKICEHHVAFFGELPPMERYLFLVMVVGEGYGGLEHRSSCSLICSRDDLPRKGVDEIDEKYRTFLGLCSHEYFHTWNVKRIKPAALIPYDLTQEVYTRLLWAFEGITSYYDDLALVRCGLISPENYLELLGQTITRVLRGSGRFKQSVADSSFEAWSKFYKQDENAPNAIVSYYTKGALVALALDLTLRKETDGQCSLDKVMRSLWQHYGRPGVGIGEAELERIIEQISGLNLGAFFEQALRGREDLPLKELLQYAAIEMNLRVTQSNNDKGGTVITTNNVPKVSLGARYLASVEGVKITHVFDDGCAQAAGIAAGDIVIAVDGIRVDMCSLEKMIAGHEVGEKVNIHAFRRDELMEFEVLLTGAPLDTCYLQMLEGVGDDILQRRNDWLGQ